MDDLIANSRPSRRRATAHAHRLKPSFDLPLMKVPSLLGQGFALARDINASRDAIWGVLTDKQKLAEFS